MLYRFLLDYAIKYGRECITLEIEKYGNEFTSCLFYVNGYYFHEMLGQGCVIHVYKEDN